MRQSSSLAVIPPAQRWQPWSARTACETRDRDIGAMPDLPVLDFEDTSPSREAFAEDNLLDRATLEADLADYLPDDADLADPRISPLRATNLPGFRPPLSIPPNSIPSGTRAMPMPENSWRRA